MLAITPQQRVSKQVIAVCLLYLSFTQIFNFSCNYYYMLIKCVVCRKTWGENILGVGYRCKMYAVIVHVQVDSDPRATKQSTMHADVQLSCMHDPLSC